MATASASSTLRRRRSSARIAVSGKPAGIAMSRDGATAFVTSTEGKFVSVIDAASRSDQGENRHARHAARRRGGSVRRFHLCVRLLYSAHLQDRRRRRRRSSRRREVGASPSGVAVSPDGALIVVADRDDDALSILDAASFRVKATVKVGAHPFGVTIDADGARVYCAECRKQRRLGGRSCDAKADRNRAGRQAALCRRPGERARLYQRSIWRDGLRLRSRNLQAGRAGLRRRIS